MPTTVTIYSQNFVYRPPVFPTQDVGLVALIYGSVEPPLVVEVLADKGKDAGSGRKKDEPPWWTQTVPVPGEPKPKRPPAEPEKVPELPRVEPKPPVATMYDGLRARSDALRAELKFTGAETKWITERLRTLGQAVAAAQEIAEQRTVTRRLEAFGERLAALQNEVIRREQAERDHIAAIRQDDEQFLGVLFEMVVSSRV